MGTFVNVLGDVNIPEEKKEAFIADALRLIDQSGLFLLSSQTAFDNRFWLMRKPFFINDCLEVTYSYFEDDFWEEAGLYNKGAHVFSGKIGGRQYNVAVQALYLLMESYSDSFCFSFNDSTNIPYDLEKWISCVLDREFTLHWRHDLWKVYEIVDDEYRNEFNKYQYFMLTFSPGKVRAQSYYSIYACLNGIKKLAASDSDKKKEYMEDSIYFKLIMNTCSDMMRFRESCGLDEEEQISLLIEFLNDKQHTDIQKYLPDYKEDMTFIGGYLIFRRVYVRIISEVYGKDFYELWEHVKNKTTSEDEISKIDYYVTIAVTTKDNKTPEYTTEAIFKVSSDDRLYWWRRDGDVTISDEMNAWFSKLNERFGELRSDLYDDDEILEWQKRFCGFLKQCLDKHVYFFEEAFYDFIGHFHKKEYRAWLMLLEEQLEELSDDKTRMRRLIALISNKELREQVFR